MKRRFFNMSALAAATATATATAAGLGRPTAPWAQGASFPPIVSLVVPFAPGGGADQLAREFANAAALLLPGTTFVVDNKPGANGVIANRHVARQKPDGATFLLGTSSTHALGTLIHRGDVDPVADFSPATLLAETTAWAVLATLLEDAAGGDRGGAPEAGHLWHFRRGLLGSSLRAGAGGGDRGEAGTRALQGLGPGHHRPVGRACRSGLPHDQRARRDDAAGQDPSARGERRESYATPAGCRRSRSRACPSSSSTAGSACSGRRERRRRCSTGWRPWPRRWERTSRFRSRLVAQGYDWVGSTLDAFARELARTMEIYTRIVATTPAGELSR